MGDFPGFRNKLPFLGYLAASACTYAISHIIALKIAPTRPKNTDVFADADLIFSLPMYSLLSFLAIQGTRDHWDKGYEAHWYANEGSARHFVMLYAAMNLVHIPITILKRQSKSYKICMTFHHVLSITCMLSGLLNDRLYFFAAFDGVCEVSTLALTTLFILKDGLVGKGSVVNTLITINGVVLWLTYFVFRICLFPTWLYFFLTECYYHKEQVIVERVMRILVQGVICW
ncbi:hypothetical protein AAMO2058_000142000 [Amorphochlora amoebiformis]